MIEFLTLAENIPFAVALAVLIAVALLEGVGAMFGAGISSILDSLLPEMDIGFNAEGPDLEAPGVFGKLLAWLRVGQVPVLILIIIFLAGFGISGLMIQKFLLETLNFTLPAIIASIPAFIIALPIVRGFGTVIHKIMPKDETDAVSTETFIGRMAVIILGESKKDNPAEAKLKDQFGKFHYIMVEPDNENDVFKQGEEVLIIKSDNAKFFAIKNSNAKMKD